MSRGYPRPKTNIDPKENISIPLWCVCGISYSEPHIFCCTIKLYNNPVHYAIWGQSYYNNCWAFRTIGENIDKFVDRHKFSYFFLTSELALDYIKVLTECRSNII